MSNFARQVKICIVKISPFFFSLLSFLFYVLSSLTPSSFFFFLHTTKLKKTLYLQKEQKRRKGGYTLLFRSGPGPVMVCVVWTVGVGFDICMVACVWIYRRFMFACAGWNCCDEGSMMVYDEGLRGFDICDYWFAFLFAGCRKLAPLCACSFCSFYSKLSFYFWTRIDLDWIAINGFEMLRIRFGRKRKERLDLKSCDWGNVIEGKIGPWQKLFGPIGHFTNKIKMIIKNKLKYK